MMVVVKKENSSITDYGNLHFELATNTSLKLGLSSNMEVHFILFFPRVWR